MLHEEILGAGKSLSQPSGPHSILEHQVEVTQTDQSAGQACPMS